MFMKTNGSLFWRQAGVATLSVARILDAYAQPPSFSTLQESISAV